MKKCFEIARFFIISLPVFIIVYSMVMSGILAKDILIFVRRSIYFED